MKDEQLIAAVHQIVQPYGLSAEIIPNILRVGVRGDCRTEEPVIILTGPDLPDRTMRKLSTEITNTLPIGGVTINITPGKWQ